MTNAWNADQWAQEVCSKLNADLLAVAVSFANEQGESRFSFMTNKRPAGQKLSLQALETLRAEFSKRHADGFSPVAFYAVLPGEESQFPDNPLVKLFERREDGYSMICESVLSLSHDGRPTEDVLGRPRVSEELLYETKLRPLFRDAANACALIRELDDSADSVGLPRVEFDDDGTLMKGREVLEEIISSGTKRLVEVVNLPAGSLGSRVASAAKVGRNDPCPCGSGWKYKKCCGDASTKTMLVDDLPSLKVDLPQELHGAYQKIVAILGSPDLGRIDADNFAGDPEVMEPGSLRDDIFKAGGMPPYPASWIETTKSGISDRPSRVGVLALHEEKLQKIVLSAFIEVAQSEDTNPVLFPLVNFAELLLDEEWNIADRVEIPRQDSNPVLMSFAGKAALGAFEKLARRLALIVRVAFGLLNWDEETVPRRTVKTKKPAMLQSPAAKPLPVSQPSIVYVPIFDAKILDISMLKRTSRLSAFPTMESQRETARRHTVRASVHRVKRPLFGHRAIPGKTVGMIRVRAHRRGDPRRGIIRKTYRLSQ
jgi:hypothetical protein